MSEIEQREPLRNLPQDKYTSAEGFLDEYRLARNEQCKASWGNIAKNAMVVPGAFALYGCIATAAEGCAGGALGLGIVGLLADVVAVPILVSEDKKQCRQEVKKDFSERANRIEDPAVRARVLEELKKK